MRYLVTGITGTLGQAVCSLLLENPENEVIGYSRDELKQSQIRKHSRLTLILGDVRDGRRLIEATRSADLIFHFAALKRVDSLEENPEEAIATNIYGTQNVLGAQRANRINRVVLSATDKGVFPVNVYGCTKQLSERLVLRNPNNVVCRYGNVLASRGSVIPTFVSAIRNHMPVPITHPEMTRFFIRIEDAAHFVVKSSTEESGGLKIPPMRAAKMTDVANAIGDILGRRVRFEPVGVRPGEKIHECIRTDADGGAMFSNTVERFSGPELIELLSPAVRVCV